MPICRSCHSFLPIKIMKNEIMEEVWRNRDAFAKKYRYDINAMASAIQEMEQHPLNRMVKKAKSIPNKRLHLNADKCGPRSQAQ
jgi:hypothetical protein